MPRELDSNSVASLMGVNCKASHFGLFPPELAWNSGLVIQGRGTQP